MTFFIRFFRYRYFITIVEKGPVKPLIFFYPDDKGVENPSYQEIRDVLAAAGLSVGVENKVYSRERSNEPALRGRIRVHLKNDDGTPINPKFTSRKKQTLINWMSIVLLSS